MNFPPLHRSLAALVPVLLGALSLKTPAHADFSFVHITDTHIGESETPGSNADKDSVLYREISNLKPKPAFALNTGDVCEIGTPKEYEFHRKSLQNLTIPNYEAPGNHDVRWNPHGKEGYTVGAKQPLYQSWDYENVHFITLDSTVLLQHWGHFDKAMLDWLRDDLKKVGPQRPVVIGFHHWIGRETVQADNEDELIAITAPYNVVLWLQGHGHSDINWNINGATALMAKGLYQGSYHLIEVNSQRMRVLRRTAEKPTPDTEVLSIPLARATPPNWSAAARINGDQLFVEAARGNLPADAKLSFRINTGDFVPLTERDNGWAGQTSSAKMTAGEHRIMVRAVLADGRTYARTVPLSVRRAGMPSPLWVRPVGGAVQSRLVRSGDALYVTTMGGDLFCLDAASGFVRWKFSTRGALFSTPLVHGDTVYFGSADHFIYAVDARRGRLKWKTKTGGAVFGGASVAKNVVCIASVDTKIYGLDTRSGKVLWTAPGEGMYQSAATTDGTRFFVGGWDNFFRAIDVVSGREAWKQKFGRAFYFAPAIGSPTIGDGKVFVTSNDGILHAMDAATGKVLWEVEGPAVGYSGPLFRDGKIYNASLTPTGRVMRFDATSGARDWDTPTGSVIYDSSCAWGDTPNGGAVYVGCVDGTFSAVNARDGRLLWQYRLAPGHVLASPATDERRVFIASQNGNVVALPLY
ncbi:MAG: 3,5-cyclic-AMP phosphodiesterase [Abditibacteriota bacterium]|nr:3,5-cyclic-AMP phosphodiesterase [Abditibacteriota bacterium]